MWTEHILIGFLALCAGMAVSAGTFAFLLVIGVLPRVLGKTSLVKRVMLIENLVIAGVIVGAAFSVVSWEAPWAGSGNVLLAGAEWCVVALYGLSAGIFVGCIAAALAEILHTLPILFRRESIKRGLSWVMISMALGKMCGGLFYFYCGYGG